MITKRDLKKFLLKNQWTHPHVDTGYSHLLKHPLLSNIYYNPDKCFLHIEQLGKGSKVLLSLEWNNPEMVFEINEEQRLLIENSKLFAIHY